MAEDLPEEFDLVVVGTGFTESCIAAAASRIGKTVLHLDTSDFYGGVWASFSLSGLDSLLLGNNVSDELRNSSVEWHIASADQTDEAKDGEECAGASPSNASSSVNWTRELLMQQSRRFNLDLCPKILYATGPLVQLLISSNICRYAEFRAVDRVCTRFNDDILNVPCSRSDVFNTKDLNIVEKRLLMKFLTICMTYGEDKADEDTLIYRGKTFREYLQQQQVTEKITKCVMQAIAMCDDETTFEDGMARTQKFLSSLGRYGNTPFLFPMYGCGEIPQCFCRLCAVFGGVYCLKRRIDEITINADTNCAIIQVDGKPVNAKHVVCSHGNVPVNLQHSNFGIHGLGTLVNGLSRGIFIAGSALGNAELNAGGGGVNVLRLLAGTKEAILVQLSHYSGTCPKEIFVFHITTAAESNDPAADLQPFMSQVFNDHPNTPTLLYAAYFTITKRSPITAPIDATTPIFCTAAPYYELDYDLSLKNARDIFGKLYDNAEFLPRAPDPDEIVVDGEDPRALSETNLPDDLRAQLHELERSAEQMEISMDHEPENNVIENQMEAE